MVSANLIVLKVTMRFLYIPDIPLAKIPHSEKSFPISISIRNIQQIIEFALHKSVFGSPAFSTKRVYEQNPQTLSLQKSIVSMALFFYTLSWPAI
jgi:hypothetical protein